MTVGGLGGSGASFSMITFLGGGSTTLPGIIITFFDGARGGVGGGSRKT
jgi:hypothetical protein